MINENKYRRFKMIKKMIFSIVMLSGLWSNVEGNRSLMKRMTDKNYSKNSPNANMSNGEPESADMPTQKGD